MVSCSELELGMLTRALTPLKVSAPPYLPCVDQAVLAVVPVLALPEASATVVPVPSSKE